MLVFLYPPFSPSKNVTIGSIEIKQIENFQVLNNKDDLRLYLQPICNIDHKIRGFETLSRVVQNGVCISPEDMVLRMERNNTISELDLFVLKELSEVMKTIDIEGEFVTVNLSAITLANNDVIDELIEYGEKIIAHGKYVYFEITETAKGDLNNIVVNSKALIARNIGVILDDYGSGYNTFGLLGKIEAKAVKISKEILDDLSDYRTYFMMVRLIKLFKEMGAEVIIEGVERTEQINIIQKVGVDYMQGYLFGKPMHYKDFDMNQKKISNI